MTASTATAPAIPGRHSGNMSRWQLWLHHPEHAWIHRALFQVHLWLGMIAALYVMLMSLTGTVIIFRDQLEGSGDPASTKFRMVEALVDLHTNLLSGETGLRINGIGAIAFTFICLTGAIIWWPGIEHWRRSLTLDWRFSFARTNWDVHNVLGFWCFLFLAIWGFTGIYFTFPEAVSPLLDWLDPTGTSHAYLFANRVLFGFTNLHFGRFNWLTEILWALMGLVPTVLVLSGVFMCCHRLFIRKGAPLPR